MDNERQWVSHGSRGRKCKRSKVVAKTHSSTFSRRKDLSWRLSLSNTDGIHLEWSFKCPDFRVSCIIRYPKPPLVLIPGPQRHLLAISVARLLANREYISYAANTSICSVHKLYLLVALNKAKISLFTQLPIRVNLLEFDQLWETWEWVSEVASRRESWPWPVITLPGKWHTPKSALLVTSQFPWRHPDLANFHSRDSQLTTIDILRPNHSFSWGLSSACRMLPWPSSLGSSPQWCDNQNVSRCCQMLLWEENHSPSWTTAQQVE